MITRIVAQRMALGRPVVVENKNGAASMIAAEHAIRSPADGTAAMQHVRSGRLYMPGVAIIDDLCAMPGCSVSQG